jgi:serine protease Do
MFGMTLAELDDDPARGSSRSRTASRGVVITEVDPDSAAAEKRIEPGE